jgi:hypothetical protein
MREEKGGKERMGHRGHIETLFLTHLVLLKKLSTRWFYERPSKDIVIGY